MGKQLALIPVRKYAYRKCARPISIRGFNHVIFKSRSYVLRKNRAAILRILRACQLKYGVRLKGIAIMENHIHLAVKVPSRTSFQNFMRVFAGLVALKVVKGKLWSQRVWSRVVRAGRDLTGVLAYIWKNPLKAGRKAEEYRLDAAYSSSTLADAQTYMNVEQLFIQGHDYARNVWFVAGPTDNRHALGIFLDGEYYLEKVGALAVLEKELESGRLPPMSFLFIPSNGPQSRHGDFVCNERYARFVAQDAVGWARSRLGSIRGEENLVCGLSLSGLASAHAALMYPGVFSAALSQSGSFWWNDKRFASIAREREKIASRHWLSVGDEELQEGVSHPPTGMYQGVSQVKGVEAAVDALKARGAEVRHSVYHGGHAFDPWRDELADALHWLVTS